jgi:rod shape-determining protein MreD
MTSPTKIPQIQAQKLFIILFIISLILSHIGIVGIEDSSIMPNYFIALIVSFILAKRARLDLFKLVIIGLIVDIFTGQLIGQYGLIFIIIYILNFSVNKILVIKYQKQIESLSIFLILFSFIILWLTSQSYNIFITPKILLLQSIFTFIAYLFFKVIINKFIAR